MLTCLFRASALTAVVAAAGCFSSSSADTQGLTPGDASVDAPPHIPGTPGLGAHVLTYYSLNDNNEPSITTPAMSVQPGSMIVVSVGRGDASAFARPTDNKGDGPYPQLGDVRPYTHWQSSGTAAYAVPAVVGGSNFRITTENRPSDEITLAAVEIIEGSRVVDFQWNEVVQPATPVPLTSHKVTTTGPATLVAFWWGDAPEPQNKTAQPNNGFTVIDSIFKSGALVQCAVAVKQVTAAGSYDVTWTATPTQGAQLWLIAVQ